MLQTERYSDWKFGVINAIEPSEIPKEAVSKAQGLFYRENRWRKMPGLVEINSSAPSSNGVWGIGFNSNLISKKKVILVYIGTDLYKLNDDLTLTSIDSTMSLNSQVEFLHVPPFTYLGSQNDKWRRYDGGTQTYLIGGDNGEADDAPRKFIRVVYSPFSGRFFGIGDPLNPDYLNYSDHIDDSGIEKWPQGNVQIIESFGGDFPLWSEIYEGRITTFSRNSISSGSVVGVPGSWSFQREKSQSGTIAGRSVKRYGNFFLMLTPDFEVYKWPQDEFITKGRVKFSINPYKAHLACAEIIENRYYDITFESGEAVATNRYHTWRYDILGDRWSGPSLQRNIVTIVNDFESNRVLCGGVDDLAGYLLELRGQNIKNTAMKCHFVTGYNHQGSIRDDKRYSKLYLKAKQSGSIGGAGQLEVIANVDNWARNPISQVLTLEDPDNQNLSETSAVRDSVIKRAHIHESFGRGSSIQIELKHEVLNGEFEFSELELEYYLRTKKEKRWA